MKHVNTLELYRELIASGLDEHQANLQLKAYEEISNSFYSELKEWLKEAKEEFASQKMLAILGGLILLVGTASIGMLWKLTVEAEVLKSSLVRIEKLEQNK